MPVFHAPSHCASHRARGEKALARLVEQVNALRARPVTGEDFEEMEREFRALFAEAEREVVGETLARLDVDLPFVEIEGRRYRRVLRSHATYTSAAGAVGVHRTLYRCGGETCGGADGAAGGDSRGALDGAGGAPGERGGGARDAAGGGESVSGVGADEALEEFTGPVAEGAGWAVGGAARGVRGDVARKQRGGAGGGDGGGVARWGDGPDEGREAGGWVCGLPGGGVWDSHVLRCRGGAARYGVFWPDAAAAQGGVEDNAPRGARSGARQAPGPARSDDCRRGARQLELSRYVGGAGDGNSGLLPRGRAPEVGTRCLLWARQCEGAGAL